MLFLKDTSSDQYLSKENVCWSYFSFRYLQLGRCSSVDSELSLNLQNFPLFYAKIHSHLLFLFDRI
jgi:hypothetical protein